MPHGTPRRSKHAAFRHIIIAVWATVLFYALTLAPIVSVLACPGEGG